MAQLPETPNPVDHGVVGPEDRIESRERDDAHMPPDPHVDPVVELLELAAEIDEVGQREHGRDLGRRREGRCTRSPGLAERPGAELGPRGAPLANGQRIDGSREERVRASAGRLIAERGRDALAAEACRPVPPAEHRARDAIAERALEEVEIGPMPGQEIRRPVGVVAGDRQREPVNPRPMLVAPVIGERQRGRDRRAQIGELAGGEPRGAAPPPQGYRRVLRRGSAHGHRHSVRRGMGRVHPTPGLAPSTFSTGGACRPAEGPPRGVSVLRPLV